MSAPPKPWEQGRLPQSQRLLNSSAPMSNIVSTPAGRLRLNAPALPPRPMVSSGYGGPAGMSGYNTNAYGGYGRSYGYSPYSSYNSYGGFGGGMYGGGYGGMGGMYGNSGFGYGGLGPESRFIQLAEESTRPAFEGIESLVRAFGSIAMMLDSTFFAVTNSFRAVLGVAENFGRIRSMFGQIWSSFALFRALNWLYRKLLSMLGVRVEDVGKEAWNQAMNESLAEGAQSPSSWPIFMFLGMIVSAPYLISKFLPPIVDQADPQQWLPRAKSATAVYEFRATNPQEMSIAPGEKIAIAPKQVQDQLGYTNTGWVLAASGTKSGTVPLNYLQPLNVRKPAPGVDPFSASVPSTAAAFQADQFSVPVAPAADVAAPTEPLVVTKEMLDQVHEQIQSNEAQVQSNQPNESKETLNK